MYTSLLLILPLLSSILALPSQQQQPLHTKEADTPDTCDCDGTKPSLPAGNGSICHDKRLGPIEIPRKMPLLSFVSDYDRFGGRKPGEFLKLWTDSETGKWVYPEKDGFCLDLEGRPIVGNMTLELGTKVDRFGSEGGVFVSAADAPYDQRALPPSNLNHPPAGDYPYNYHVYTVAKPLIVAGGPIRPWFGQPGLGAQFWTGATGNVSTLVELGYLQVVHKGDIEEGPGRGGGCGL